MRSLEPPRRQGAPACRQEHARLSCVVCAYNEAERLPAVISAVAGHPAIDEVIVVDDGSSDATASVLARFENVRVVTHAKNLGKAAALRSGLTAARGANVLLLDADLAGLAPAHIHALVDPVLGGGAQASISLRANSLWIYRLIGLDFVSGERVVPTALVRDALHKAEHLPRWGGEAMINQLIVRERLPLAIVPLSGVFNIRKHRKVGWWRGAVEELKMVRDALAVLTPLGAVRQNLALLQLARPLQVPSTAAQAIRLGMPGRPALRRADNSRWISTSAPPAPKTAPPSAP